MVHGRFTSLFTKTQFTKKTFKNYQVEKIVMLAHEIYIVVLKVTVKGLEEVSQNCLDYIS